MRSTKVPPCLTDPPVLTRCRAETVWKEEPFFLAPFPFSTAVGWGGRKKDRIGQGLGRGFSAAPRESTAPLTRVGSGVVGKEVGEELQG